MSRSIKQQALHSPSLARLSHGAERLWWRLVRLADGRGRFQADAVTLLATAFPKQTDTIEVSDIRSWLTELTDSSDPLIALYTCNNRPYGVICSAARHFPTSPHARSRLPVPPPDVQAQVAPVPDPPNYGALRPVVRALRASIAAWRPTSRALTRSEDQHLLDWGPGLAKLRNDGAAIHEMVAVLRWLAQGDSDRALFWQSNIRSGMALYKHWDRLNYELQNTRGRPQDGPGRAERLRQKLQREGQL